MLEIYGADGEREEIDDLEKGGIIAAAQSKDLSFALIKKVLGTLDGTLEAKDADGKIYINGEKYTLTDYAKRNCSDIMKLNEKLFVCTGVK
ncbi:MAG: S26 family signal peptidase [Clostridiales bacterium]|nr:MAG: S26 family signal peptidase [Clostridiales bacterium]